jgi:hypothetical protein
MRTLELRPDIPRNAAGLTPSMARGGGVQNAGALQKTHPCDIPAGKTTAQLESCENAFR